MKVLQVVGHTPVKTIEKSGSVISCDVFSTYRNGEPIGRNEYLLIDTVTGEFRGIRRSEANQPEADDNMLKRI